MKFTTNIAEAIRASRAIFIAVGTPQAEVGSADLQSVLDVARSIGEYMNNDKLVITKSTVPVGTGKRIADEIQKTGTKHKASIVSNPEFLREGSAIEDFMEPDRVVIGAWEPEALALM